mmetsp:Transcript_30799/g.67232  ORF Transcript_30799/g.67232 Transcript_30799/m.67232 type:complete len:285 (+) Transcript_30799:604-1458(+)
MGDDDTPAERLPRLPREGGDKLPVRVPVAQVPPGAEGDDHRVRGQPREPQHGAAGAPRRHLHPPQRGQPRAALREARRLPRHLRGDRVRGLPSQDRAPSGDGALQLRRHPVADGRLPERRHRGGRVRPRLHPQLDAPRAPRPHPGQAVLQGQGLPAAVLLLREGGHQRLPRQPPHLPLRQGRGQQRQPLSARLVLRHDPPEALHVEHAAADQRHENALKRGRAPCNNASNCCREPGTNGAMTSTVQIPWNVGNGASGYHQCGLTGSHGVLWDLRGSRLYYIYIH